MSNREYRRHIRARFSAPSLMPLAAAIATVLFPAILAISQEALGEEIPAAGVASVEEVVVTGSPIRKNSFASAAAMEVVLPGTAAASGVPDLAALLRSSTAAAGTSHVAGILTGAGGPGGCLLSSRGIGANRKPILLNGRGAGLSELVGSSVDLSVTFLLAPVAIAIQKVGASAIYGYDSLRMLNSFDELPSEMTSWPVEVAT